LDSNLFGDILREVKNNSKERSYLGSFPYN